MKLINFIGLSIILFINIVQIQCVLKESRIRYVDKYDKQYLLRGPSIVSETGQYKYFELRTALQKITNTTEHRITIISLQNFLSAKETKERYVQQNFYNQIVGKPDRAKVDHHYSFYVHHTVLGTPISPAMVPIDWRETVSKIVVFDDIDKLMETIRYELEINIRGLVYVHCSQGFDRVGYVIGAYKMKYLNATMEEVMKQNLKIIKQERNHMGFWSYNGLQWYCLSLGRSDQQCLIGKNSRYIENNQL